MQSMTGYGRGTASKDGREITVELKSVNHRYLDLGMRLPRHLAFLEDLFRKLLSETISRGHVDLFVNYRNTRSDARTVIIDESLLRAYVDSAHQLNHSLGLHDDLGLSAALRLPDVTEIREADEDPEAVSALAETAFLAAVEALRAMRKQEGERLKADLIRRVDAVEALTNSIRERAPLVIEEYRVKLNERIEQLLQKTEIDRTRLATEVALFADKASIDEEIVRLSSHIAQMRLLFEDSEPVGRRMDFVVQEMNREFNTIGSKANDAALTQSVLSGKAEIEKIREQIQNLE